MMTATRSFSWTVESVASALAGLDPVTLDGPGARPGGTPLRRISTDTRTLEPGDVYVALAGPHFDGHDFLAAALEAGARGLVVRQGAELPTLPTAPDAPNAPTAPDATTAPNAPAAAPHSGRGGVPVWQVTDTLVALGRLARHRRDHLEVPVVAITGSTGKTTTKEFLRAALASKGMVHATRANENNRVGVPHTLLATPDEASAVILEVGTNGPGEIGALARVAAPDLVILTTVSASHLEGLGSLEGVMEEKLDLVRGLHPEAPVVVGMDPPELAGRVREIHPSGPIDVAGLTESDTEGSGSSVHASSPWMARVEGLDSLGRPTVHVPPHVPAHGGSDWTIPEPGLRARLSIPGRGPAAGALLALAAAVRLGVEPQRALEAMESVEPLGLRGRIRSVGSLVLLEDCYNANPQSTRAALDLLSELQGPRRRVAVLGSMLELGTDADALHRDVLAHARAGSPRGPAPDLLVLVGDFARVDDLPSDDALRVDTPAEVPSVLGPLLKGDETILLKASRGVRLEQVSSWLEATFGGGGD